MSLQIVVARFNENISWLNDKQTDIVIYNKGRVAVNTIALPNVGREAHTYLYHIVNNYYTLADITVFTQAKIDDHGYSHNVDILKNLAENAKDKGYSLNMKFFKRGTDYMDPDFNLQIRHLLIYIYNVREESVDKIVFIDWFKKYINPQYPDELTVYLNAIFAVSKEKIHTRPKEFYENLLTQVSNENAPIEAHFLERSWYYIFNPS